MKVFVVGKVNQNTGGFYYFHAFTGEKEDNGTLVVNKTVLFFSEDNAKTPSIVYPNMYSHKEEELDKWLRSLIERAWNHQTFYEGDWYSNL